MTTQEQTDNKVNTASYYLEKEKLLSILEEPIQRDNEDDVENLNLRILNQSEKLGFSKSEFERFEFIEDMRCYVEIKLAHEENNNAIELTDKLVDSLIRDEASNFCIEEEIPRSMVRKLFKDKLNNLDSLAIKVEELFQEEGDISFKFTTDFLLDLPFSHDRESELSFKEKDYIEKKIIEQDNLRLKLKLNESVSVYNKADIQEDKIEAIETIRGTINSLAENEIDALEIPCPEFPLTPEYDTTIGTELLKIFGYSDLNKIKKVTIGNIDFSEERNDRKDKEKMLDDFSFLFDTIKSPESQTEEFNLRNFNLGLNRILPNLCDLHCQKKLSVSLRPLHNTLN